MEFARRGPATDEVVVEEGRLFLDPPPPPHGDAVLVIRDALLLQLQQDRLRREIIMSELTKIDRAMALSSTSCQRTIAGDVKWSKLPYFGEKFMLHRRWPVSLEHWADVDFQHDLKEGERQGDPESRTARSAMEDRVGECSRPCCTGKEREENATLDEQKLQEYNENMQPKESSPWELTGITMPVKKPKSRQKWNCTICHVQTYSEQQFLEHCAGRKHRSNVATLEPRNRVISQMAETTAELSLCAGQKTCPIKWTCSTCQANGTSEADLKEHLNSSVHRQNVEEQCKEYDGMAKIAEPQEEKSHLSNVAQPAEKPPPAWSYSICRTNCTSELEFGSHVSENIQALPHEINNTVRNSESLGVKLPPNIEPQQAETSKPSCSICQTNCYHQSDLAGHLEGQICQLKIQVPHKEAMQTENIPTRIDKNQPASEWDCSICEANCYTEFHFEHHCRGKRHRKKIAALQQEDVEEKSTGLKTENKVPSDGSDSMSATSDKVEVQMTVTPCVCDVSNLLCSSENICADHCSGQEHLEKQKLLNFCEVCNLQCNSEKMLAHHCTGKKHQKKLNAKK